MGNCVSINLKTDQIVIKIFEEAEQEQIVNDLREKLPDLKNLYKDAKTPIRIAGKVLKNKEIDEIKDLVKAEIDVDIEFDTPKSLGLASIVKTFKKDIAVSETKFHRGSLRSGQRLEVESSVVILGDVNSGAEVVASDNIVVLGNLRGLAHAGAKGNKEAIVAAGNLDAVQIRISNVIKEIDKDDSVLNTQVYAYVDGDKIVIN